MSEFNMIEQFNNALDALFGNPDKVSEYIAEDILWINHLPKHIPFGGEYRGLDALQGLFEHYIANLDIGKLEFTDFHVAENNVLVVVGCEHDSGVKSTGKRYSMPYVFVVRFNEEGEMTYLREHNDTYQMGEAFKP